MATTISDARQAGREDALAGKPAAEAPEKAFVYGRERKTKEINDRNAKEYKEYLAGYNEGVGVGE